MPPGILSYDLADFQSAARTYRADLLRLPILALAAALQYMTLRPGIRYEEMVGSTSIDVELEPYKRNKVNSKNLDLVLRPLRTFFGSLNAEFDPNDAISTLLGHRASLASGEALAQTPQAHEILALAPKAVGRRLLAALFAARRDPEGTSTMDLFDGFDTITENEIAAGKISTSEGNLIVLSEAPTSKNAVQLLVEEVLYKLSPELRATPCNLYCSQDILDAYNRNYKLESGAVAYNREFEQVAVEGSNGLLKFCPMVGKAGSSFIHVSPKENMLVGVDQISDTESIRIGNYSPDTFMVMMRMFFGTQFESIDPRRFMAVEIPGENSGSLNKENNEIPDNYDNNDNL